MAYMLRASYAPNWRVFVPVSDGNVDNERIHKILIEMSIWGGADKSEEMDGLIWKGYEFKSLDHAMHWIKVCENQ